MELVGFALSSNSQISQPCMAIYEKFEHLPNGYFKDSGSGHREVWLYGAADTAEAGSAMDETPRWAGHLGVKKSSDLVIHPFFRLDFYHLSVYAVFEQRQDNLRFVPDSAESNSALSWTALRWKCF